MATLTSSLIVRLIDQVTGPAKKVANSLNGLSRAATGDFGSTLAGAIQRNNAALDQARGKLFDAVAGFYALKAAIVSPVQAAMQLESAMADVTKVVDFGSTAAIAAFKDELLAMSKRIPTSVNGLAQIAAAAGQAGIAREDLLKFTEAAAKIGVAFDISADEAGDAMAKLMTGLGLTIDEAVSLTDAMNHLSNAQASSASEILDVVRRVGAQAKQFGFSAEQVAAFGSAMISAGAESDVAATSFRNMGLALTKGASATKNQKEAFAELGLKASDVARRMQEDAVGTTIDVLERISKLPKEMQAAVSSDLFGNEARALGPLLTNLNLVRESLGLVATQSQYAGSSFKEYETRSKTFANAVQLFQNRIEALKVVIGEALIPAINELMGKLEPVIEQVTQFARAHPELVRNVMMAAGSLVAFKIAMAGLSFVGLLGKGGALSMLALGFNTVGRAVIGASKGAKGAVALQAALAAMSGLKMGGIETVLVALRGMAMAAPGVAQIGSALTAVGAALAAVSAPVWGAVAAAVAVFAGAGFLLWKYWDRVSSVVGGFIGKLGELIAQIPGVQPALDLFAQAGRLIGEGWEVAMSKLREFGNWIGSFFQREVLTEEQKAAFGQAGADAAQAMVDSVKNAINALVEWFKGLPGRIATAIGNIDIGSLIKWPSLPSWLGGGQASSTGNQSPANYDAGTQNLPVPSGHRAKGGNVWPGGSFLVGDGGEEEIFTPKTAGTITPASQAGGGSTSIGDVTIIIKDARDPQATAREVRNEVANLMRGAHADTTSWSG